MSKTLFEIFGGKHVDKVFEIYEKISVILKIVAKIHAAGADQKVIDDLHAIISLAENGVKSHDSE